MNELSSALRDLAGEVVPPNPADPASLWRQGRTRVRRRRVAAVAAVAALAAVVGAGTFAVAPVEIVPAGTQQVLGVPKNVWPAHAWYPGTHDRPPGVLAVMGGLGRDGGTGLFGVTAGTGEYRLLDLPGRADLGPSESAALSPDGRHVAYWLTGEPSGEPYPEEGSDLPVGIGVYNTVDGTVERFVAETEHGISADGLVWFDRDTLLLTYGQRTSATAADRITTYTWQPDLDPVTGRFAEPTAIRPDLPLLFRDQVPNQAGGLMVVLGSRNVGVLNMDGTMSREGLVRLPRPTPDETYDAASVARDRVVVRVVQSDGEEVWKTGEVDADGEVARLDPITGVGAQQLVGWLADDRLLTLGRNGNTYADLYEVDLAPRGLVSMLGTAEGGEWAPGLSFATDLLRLPLVDGIRPPQVDPRWRWAGIAAGGVLLLGLASTVVLRRRRG